MSWQAVAWAQRMGDSYELQPAPTLLLIVLGNYSDDDGHNAFPSLESLQRKTRMSESTVRRHLGYLESLGLIAPDSTEEAEARMRDPRYRPNVWRLVMDDAERRMRAVSKPKATPKVTGNHKAKAARRQNDTPKVPQDRAGEQIKGCQTDTFRGVISGVKMTPDSIDPSREPKRGRELERSGGHDVPLEAGDGRPVARPNEVTAEQRETRSRGTVQASSDETGAGAHEAGPQHLAEVVALKSAARARQAPSRDPQPVVDLDLGRQLRESIRKRRELKTVAGAK